MTGESKVTRRCGRPLCGMKARYWPRSCRAIVHVWPPWVSVSGPDSQVRAVAAGAWASAVETLGVTTTTGRAAVTWSPDTTAPASRRRTAARSTARPSFAARATGCAALMVTAPCTGFTSTACEIVSSRSLVSGSAKATAGSTEWLATQSQRRRQPRVKKLPVRV